MWLIFSKGTDCNKKNNSHGYRCHGLVIADLFPDGIIIKIIQCDLCCHNQNRDQRDPVRILMGFGCSHINVADQCSKHSCPCCKYHPVNCGRLRYGQYRSKSHCCVCFSCHNSPLIEKNLTHPKQIFPSAPLHPYKRIRQLPASPSTDSCLYETALYHTKKHYSI